MLRETPATQDTPMKKHALILILAAASLGGCKNRANKTVDTASPETDAVTYNAPPNINAGISVEQAYEAVPHRRTIWDESDTSVPANDRAYLSAIFQVLDEAVAVRVAGMQNYSAGHFEYSDPSSEYGQLLSYVQGMEVPKGLENYHRDIIAGLTGQQQFFADWKSQAASFPYAQQIANHPEVQKASAALRAAYSELMSKYPNEAQKNKDAFFDYHCALDFL
jgi:hypothetical protein